MKTSLTADGGLVVAVTEMARLDSTNDTINIGAYGGASSTPIGSYLPLATYTGTQTGAAISRGLMRGVLIYLDITAIPNTSATLTMKLRCRNPVSNVVQSAYSATAIAGTTAAASYIYCVYPGATSGAYSAVSGVPVPNTFLIEMTHSNGDSWTYRISYELLP